MHIARPKLQKELVVHLILILFHILYFHGEATFLGAHTLISSLKFGRKKELSWFLEFTLRIGTDNSHKK
jgi:hypothetical protein